MMKIVDRKQKKKMSDTIYPLNLTRKVSELDVQVTDV